MYRTTVLALSVLLLTTVAASAQSWGRGGAYTGASPRAAYYLIRDRERTGAHGRPPQSALIGVRAAESSTARRAICPEVASYKGH